MLANRFRRIFFFVFAVVFTAPMANGETLTDQLVIEDASKLAQQARETGDIVRGAILFHQGNINCVKCHGASGNEVSLGPNLGLIERSATDASIVESMLQPSKVLKKGYEPLIVQTFDGEVLSGVVVRQDDQEIVLRNIQDAGKLITIPRDEVELSKPGTVSSMPDGLIDQLKGRGEFLDLLRYVIDIKERGLIASPENRASLVQRELSDELKGWVAIERMNCVACHASSVAGESIVRAGAPDLKWSAKHLNPLHLKEFIANPHKVKPGSSMPDMLSHQSPVAREESAEAIVQYLVSIDGNEFVESDLTPDTDSVTRGNELFHSLGCVACHAPRDEQAIEQPLAGSLPLGNVSNKYSHSALVTFLKDPHVVRASGRMPNMQLTHREAEDVSAYLRQDSKTTTGVETPAWRTDLALVANGKKLFSQLQCANCHSGIVETDDASVKIASLASLNPEKGCLSDTVGNWPSYRLDEEMKRDVRAALASSTAEFTNRQRIDFTLTSYNCTACHSRDSLGGVSADRNHHFQTTNLNLGDQGRIPPTLTGVGAKLNAKWMRDVLVNHRVIRPYMKTRMPQYGEKNIGHLVDLFQSTDSLSPTEFAAIDDPKEMRKHGLKIAGNKGLNCVACHTYQYKPADTMPAVDLTEMAERLKKDWFYQYMLAPQKFSPNTVMPSFWPGGKAIRVDLEGTPESQLEDVWQYLLEGRQANVPSGVIREPLEIVVDNEARMLRRSYQGIGKRGIGVGYPGNVNLAFDTEQLRLAMIWKGKFVDPSGVWYGQGHGNVRAMERTIDFAKGPDLDNRDGPWKIDEGRPPRHTFEGYSLDEIRRPTFRYRFENIQVEDFSNEVLDSTDEPAHLRRRVTITSPTDHDGLRLRIGGGEEIVAESDNSFRIGQRLIVRVTSDHVAEVSNEGESPSLNVPLELLAEQVETVIVEYLWSDR